MHVQVTPDGARCVCGNRGCLFTETEVVVRGLRGRPAPGDGAMLGLLLGRAFSSLVTTLDPDCVVVDARLAQECGPFIAEFTLELARHCPPEIAVSLPVVPGDFTDAERYGALAAADAHAAVLVSEIASPRWPAAACAPPAEVPPPQASAVSA